MKKICYITTIVATMDFFTNQMNYLSHNGYEVHAICSYGDDYKKYIGEDVKFIPVEIARGISPFTLKKSISELKKVFKENEFDIIQYSTPNAAFVASIAAKMAGASIRNYHLMGLRYLGEKGMLRFILKFLEKVTCKFSTHIECVSRSNYDLAVKEKLFPKEKGTVVWNGSSGGVNLKRFDFNKRNEWRKEVRTELSLKEDDLIFGFVGRITRDKGINELFSTFLSLSDKAKLLLIGANEGIDTLDAELFEKAKNNSNVIFCDFKSDIERYFAAIDVLVLPSYREGFGNVIIEAGAVGTPSIISDIPGPIDAVLPGKTAKLVEVKNVEALKSSMEEFINNKDLAAEMSNNAYNYVLNNFDSDKLNEKILERKNLLLGK